MYDYDMDKSVLIPNYKEIKFTSASRWNNSFGIFGDIFYDKKESKFGAASESCISYDKVYEAQRTLTHLNPVQARSFS